MRYNTSMEFFISKKDLQKVEDNNLVDTLRDRVLAGASKDFIACFVSGCTMDIKMDDDKFKMSTRYPIYLLKHPNGDILSVVEKKI